VKGLNELTISPIQGRLQSSIALIMITAKKALGILRSSELMSGDSVPP
jgi:hypothetical protein